MFLSILTLEYSLNLGSFFTFWGYEGLCWGQGRVQELFWVSLYRLISLLSQYGSISRIQALSSSLKFRGGRPDGYVKIMPLVAPTPQLRLRWTELSWSVGAECGKKTKGHFLDKVFSPAKLFTLFDPFFILHDFQARKIS